LLFEVLVGGPGFFSFWMTRNSASEKTTKMVVTSLYSTTLSPSQLPLRDWLRK